MGRLAGELGCKIGEWPILYLGLKVGGRCNGAAGWGEVVDRVKKRLTRWDSKSISLGGRATIVRSVLTSIPLYTLSFLKLPKKVENELRSIQCSFLWGGNEMWKRIAWVSWDELCKPKAARGLGIKDLRLFNKVLLSKWIWRLNNKDD